MGKHQRFRVESVVEQRKGPSYTWITVQKVKEFIDNALEGMVFKGHQNARLILTKKHPFIAETDKGCFQWIDMYMWNVRKTDSATTSYEWFYVGD